MSEKCGALNPSRQHLSSQIPSACLKLARYCTANSMRELFDYLVGAGKKGRGTASSIARLFVFLFPSSHGCRSNYCSEQGPDACRESHCECTPESHAYCAH